MLDWQTDHKLQQYNIMAILSVQNEYINGQSVTADNLNALVNNASFVNTSNGATDDTSLEVHSGGYLKVKDDGITNAKIATNAVNADSLASDAVTTAKIKDSTGASDGVTTAKIATGAVTVHKLGDGAVTAAKISATDTNLNFNSTNNNIGVGVAADANFQLTVDGGSSKDTIYAKGNQTGAYVDLTLEQEHASGNGGRVRIIQGSNTASLQYQESGERATLNIVDGSLSANAGITVACSSATQASVQPTGSMFASNNSNVDLGGSNNTWDNGYINGGTWTASDENIKQDISDLNEAELKVASALKSMMKKFRLKEAVNKKGDNARIHVGVIAQQVKSAFEAEGLEAYRYAIIGENTWWEKQDEQGEWIFKDEETEGFTKKVKMSVRYEQLLSFIITAL